MRSTEVSVQQCTTCGRWLPKDLLTVVAVGADCTCGVCAGIAQLQSVVPSSAVSVEKEEQALVALLRAFNLLCGR